MMRDAKLKSTNLRMSDGLVDIIAKFGSDILPNKEEENRQEGILD